MYLNNVACESLLFLSKNQRTEWFVEVLQLQQGQSFGELALLNNKPRAATVKTLTDCIFAVIGRTEYQRVL